METVKKIIEVTVRGRVATHVGDDFYVCGNTDYEIHFDFDEEWDALDVKTARFIGEGNVVYPDRIFSGNVCSFPDNPPISNTTNVRVGVFAGNLQTTTPARIPAAKSILCGTSTPAAPDDDAYHEAMEEMAKVATEARTKAAESARSAEEAAQSAVEAAEFAQASAQKAETAGQHVINADAKAKEAGSHAEAAAKSASDAANSAESAETAKRDAIANADDAEAAAKDAQTWAGRAEAHAGNAGTSADNAATSAQEAATSADDAAASATEAEQAASNAKTTADSITQDMQGEDGRGALYLITCNGNQSNRTQAEVRAAVAADKTVLAVDLYGTVYHYIGEKTAVNVSEAGVNVPTFFSYMTYENNAIGYIYAQLLSDGRFSKISGANVKVPAPYALRMTGAVKATYDGSETVQVEIPEAPVKSVNGQTGDVTVNVPVTSVNGKTGDVTLDIPDVYIVKMLAGGASSATQAEVRAAVSAGKTVLAVHYNGTVYHNAGEQESENGETVLTFFSSTAYNDGNLRYKHAQLLSSNEWSVGSTENIKVPNPFGITFTGAVSTKYDGSGAVTVRIPDAPEQNVYIVTLTWSASGVWLSDKTRADIDAAAKAGKACLLRMGDGLYTYVGGYKFVRTQYREDYDGIICDYVVINEDQSATAGGYGPFVGIPTTATASAGYVHWDGIMWETVDIDIPEAVTDEHINELIDAKLGVIENGAY